MADDFLGLGDLVADAFDLADYEVSDLVDKFPLLAILGFVPSSNGVVHKYSKETGAPIVGFRSANAGRDLDSSEDTIVSIDLKALDFTWAVDTIVAKAWRKGVADAIAREGLRHVRSAMATFEKQLINGTVGIGQAAGFAGFRQAGTVVASNSAMVVNAAGNTANTGSSVWALRAAEDGVTGVYHGDGDTFQLEETVIVDMKDGDGKHYAAWYTPGNAWLAMQVGSAYDIGRICNLTVAAPLNDNLLADLISKFPVGFGPTHFVMSRRSIAQLRKSRTATNATGAEAPFPTEAHGIPIVITEAQSDTEAILA